MLLAAARERCARDGIVTQVIEALEAAADSDNRFLAGDLGRHATSSHHRVATTKTTILRFLENLPEDMTVIEIREALDSDS